jgi:aminoacrylate hydrolase
MSSATMRTATRTTLHVEVTGRDLPDAPTVLLSSGLGGSAGFWKPQLAALGERFRVVTYDHRGTGRSPGVLPQGYAMADMARDALEAADAAGVTRCYFVGHALGGLIGVQMAIERPGLIARLAIINGWDRIDTHTERCFDVRLDLLRHAGPAAYVRAQPIFLYPAAWLSMHADAVAAEQAHALASFPGAASVEARIGALRAYDPGEALRRVAMPTLVIGTRDDVLVPYTRSERLAAVLPDARLQLFDEGGHAVTVTDPTRCNAALVDFLGSVQ